MIITCAILGVAGLGVIISMLKTLQSSMDSANHFLKQPRVPCVPRHKAMYCLDCDSIYEYASCCPKCQKENGMVLGGNAKVVNGKYVG